MYTEVAEPVMWVAERDTVDMVTSVAAFIKELQYLRGLSPQTVSSYVNAVRSYINFAHITTPSDITIDSIHEWSIHLARTGMSLGARSTYLIGIRQFCVHLNRTRDLDIDVRDIMIPKRKDPPRKFLTKEQIDRIILAAGSYRDKAIISLLFTSGIRCSELVALDRADLAYNDFIVQGKGGRVRPCYISTETRRWLDKYFQERTDAHPAAFIGTKKYQRLSDTQIRIIVAEAGEFAGIDGVHPHMLRHSFATHLLNSGCDIESLRKLMGHTNIATTQRYLHVTDHGLKETHKLYF